MFKNFPTAILLFCARNIFADELPSRAKNVVYAQVSTLYISSALSINYELALLHHRHTVRAGFSRGYHGDTEYFIVPLKTQFDNAISLTTFYLAGSFENKFELGGGVAYALDANIFAPVIAIGYRYQPYDGGIFYRAGFEYAYFYGLHLSAGYCF